MARGLTNEEIAKELCISSNTVRSHLQNISIKLGVSRRAQIAGQFQGPVSVGELIPLVVLLEDLAKTIREYVEAQQ